MKNAYLRNMMISVAVHVACVYVLIAFSLCSCHFRRPPKDLAFFVDFQPGPPPPPRPLPPPASTPVSEPVDVPKPIPEPPKPKTTPPENAKKPKIEISTNLVRRAAPAGVPAAPGTKRPVKQLSAAQIRRMLGTAMASVGPPAGSGSGETTPYGWYLAQVRAVMYDAWQQPSALAGKHGLVTRVLVRVRQDGQIVRKKMVDTSGNGLMDTSVMTAVESVENLPELPFGFGGAYKDITIDFELEDTGP
ncbi:MAG: energy transducer TonB [Verrucomicrobiota bacterium]